MDTPTRTPELKWVRCKVGDLHLCYSSYPPMEIPATCDYTTAAFEGLLKEGAADIYMCADHTLPWCTVCNWPFCYCLHNPYPFPSQCTPTQVCIRLRRAGPKLNSD